MVIIAGQVLDRVRNHVLVMAIAIIAQAVAFIWSFQLGDANLVALYMLLLGCIGSWIPVATFTVAPETMPRPELAGLALGIVSVG